MHLRPGTWVPFAFHINRINIIIIIIIITQRPTVGFVGFVSRQHPIIDVENFYFLVHNVPEQHYMFNRIDTNRFPSFLFHHQIN